METFKEQIYKTKCAKPEIFEWYSKKGAVSIFIYSAKVMKNGTLSFFDDESRKVRAIQKAGETYVPAVFFEKFLGLELEQSQCGVRISNGKKTLEAKVNKSSFAVDGIIGNFASPVQVKDGHKYLPAIRVAEQLGISCRGFEQGRLTVFASEKILDEIDRDTELLVSAIYATLGKYDASKFTKEDFDAVKDKWRTVLVGSPEMNDTSDPELREKLSEMSAQAKLIWDSLHTEIDRFILWGDAPPKESSDLTAQYSKIWILAKCYGTYGTDYYKNENLKDTILDCLKWMYENMYGEAEIEDRGWRSMRIFNWWDWFFGGIEPFTNVLMVMEEHLSMEQKKLYLRAFKHVLTIHRVGYYRHFAMSRLNVCTKAALLLEDRAMLEEECADYDLILGVTKDSEGVHTDYVEWTHGYPYNMMYGFNNLSRAGFTGTLLGGTVMEYISPKQYELYNVAKYMFEAACYKGQGFMAFNGRGTAGTEFSCGVAIMNGVLPLIGLWGEEEDIHLKKLIKRCASTPRLIKMLKTACSVYNFAKLMKILRDDSVSAENDYEVAHAWFTGDRIAQHRNDYAFIVAMTSKRHPSYESINSANKQGWYTCDGALYLYTNADRNVYDGANFIVNPNICQRIAGTTVDDRERQPWSYRSGWKSPRSFAGCMDVRGKYGMAAFDYESYNYSGHEADNTVDNDYGGGYTYWENDLEAKKAYFFFDKECVCLGAGINSTMNSNVITTIEHRRLVKDADILGAEDIYLNDELMPKDEYEKISDKAEWLWLEGVAGYVLPSGGRTRVCKYNYVSDLSKTDDYFAPDPDEEKYKDGKPFFEINLYHGKNPKNAGYEYIILPNITAEQTKRYSQNPEVQIVANNKACQAVRKASLGITYIVFHEAGECFGVKASEPCLITLSEENGELTLSVVEPTHELKSVRVELNKKYELIKASSQSNVSHCRGCEKTLIDVDTNMAVGEAIRVVFKL